MLSLHHACTAINDGIFTFRRDFQRIIENHFPWVTDGNDTISSGGSHNSQTRTTEEGVGFGHQ